MSNVWKWGRSRAIFSYRSESFADLAASSLSEAILEAQITRKGHQNRNQFTMHGVHRSAHIYCLCVGLLRGRIRLLPKQPLKIENWIIFVFFFCFYCPICEVFTFNNRLCCAFVSLAFWKQIKKATFRSFLVCFLLSASTSLTTKLQYSISFSVCYVFLLSFFFDDVVLRCR